MEQQRKAYQNLYNLSREVRILSGISSLIEWDQETFMPPDAAGIRAEQIETLASIIHLKKTSDAYKNALAKLVGLKKGTIKATKLTKRQQAGIREWRRDFLKATKLPNAFVKSFAKLCSESITVWKGAKQSNAFKEFEPYLEKIVSMSRKKADLLGYEEHPYDALLDEYEPGTTYKELSKLFGQVRQPIIALLKKIVTTPKIDRKCLEGRFPVEKQIAFSYEILSMMGYTDKNGRLDLSAHPFSSSCHPTDSRITTRINTPSIAANILTVLHEGGHSLYEMGLPQEDYGTPLGEAISLGMHESQSRWWETRIGQSKGFWHHILPLLKKEFPGKLDKTSLDAFYQGVNRVTPSLIRVEADELTYPLHVMLRFDLEYKLIEGSLKVKDLPDAWNQKMKDYLGIIPPSNREGCLQDIHWAMGAFGYFPTYALGNIYAAHLFEKFEKEHKNWEKRVADGNFLFIKEWLNEHIHSYGRQYSSAELLKKVTGKTLSAKAYIDYLDSKYSKLYSL